MFNRKAQKKSPLKKKPLRQAGQSLTDKINQIYDEKILFYKIIIILLATFSIFEWYRWIFKIRFNPLFLTILTSIVAAFLISKIVRHKRSIERLHLARDGEKIIGEMLDELRNEGHFAFHDIIGGNFNIDHVMVGTKGIFTIETKTISKPAKGQAEIHYDGNKVTINGHTPERDPIIQAKAQANWLKDLLQEFTGKKFPVQPVVLYPGWFVSPQPKGAEVWVLNDKAFPSFLENMRPALNSEEIQTVAANLSQYARGSAHIPHLQD